MDKMNITIYYITIWSILLPLVVSILRYKKIGSIYLPFILLIWIGCLNELVGEIVVSKGYSNAVSSNIYSLIEAIIILWLFRQMDAPRFIKKIFHYVALGFCIVWTLENVFIGKFGVYFNSYFNMVSGFVIVLISINAINEILVKEKDLLKNPLFLLCTGFIIYFTYRTLIEAFWIYGQDIGEQFMSKVFSIHSWINLVCNIIFALAILWMQKRQAFTLRYS